MTRYRCVDDQKAAGFPVTAACEAAGVSTSGFYDWRAREAAGPTERQVAEAELVELMRDIFDASDGNYGVPRMYDELRRAGVTVNEKRVRRLMRLHGMAGRCRRRRCQTTFPGPDGYVIPDLIGRRFEPGAPDVAWVQDITYIATGEGWLYLASVLDLGSRRLLGYSMADHMRTELVLDALGMAVAARGGAVAGVDRPRRPRLAVHLQRLPRVLPHPPDPPLGRSHRGVLGQRRRRVVLGVAQARVHPGPRVRHPRRGPPGDLPLDQLVQHDPAAHQPQQRPTHRVGTAVPSSVITTRPADGEMARAHRLSVWPT